MTTLDARGVRQRDRVAKAVLYAILAIGLLVVVGPFIWMALSSLKPRYVVWGEGTSDEMCLGVVVWSARPHRP